MVVGGAVAEGDGALGGQLHDEEEAMTCVICRQSETDPGRRR
jgi:hypothetical protein